MILNPGTYYAVVVNIDKKAFEVEYSYSESTNPGKLMIRWSGKM